jgi:hypothetical protein
MLQAEECQRRAEECARLAGGAVEARLVARYRHLEQSWLYLARLKLRARAEREARPSAS